MKYMVFLLVIFISLTAAGQNNTIDERMAKSTLYEFVHAINDRNFGFAKKLCTENSKDVLRLIEEDAKYHTNDKKKQEEMSQAKIDYKSIRFKDNKCFIRFTISVFPKRNDLVTLLKAKDKWLIDLEASDEEEAVEVFEEIEIVEDPQLTEDQLFQEKILIKEVVGNFLKALANENYDFATKLSTQGSHLSIEMYKVSMTMIPDSLIPQIKEKMKKARRATINYSSIDIIKNNCCVKYRYSHLPYELETLYLSKINDQWFVDLLATFDNPAAEEIDEYSNETDQSEREEKE